MILSFEAYRFPVLVSLQSPQILREAARILLNGNRRPGELEIMKFHFCKFFGMIPPSGL
jgi:hypothetical protein